MLEDIGVKRTHGCYLVLFSLLHAKIHPKITQNEHQGRGYVDGEMIKDREGGVCLVQNLVRLLQEVVDWNGKKETHFAYSYFSFDQLLLVCQGRVRYATTEYAISLWDYLKRIWKGKKPTASLCNGTVLDFNLRAIQS